MAYEFIRPTDLEPVAKEDLNENACLWIKKGNTNYRVSIKTLREYFFNIAHPIGSVFITTELYTKVDGKLRILNPHDIFGFGTWEAYSNGAMLFGYKQGDSNFGTITNTTRGNVKTNHKYDGWVCLHILT